MEDIIEKINILVTERDIEHLVLEAKVNGVDEWGIIEYGNEYQCVEYNFCIDSSTDKIINESAFYPATKDENGWHTDCSHFFHFEVDFESPTWKKNLEEGARKAYEEIFKEIHVENGLMFCEVSELNEEQKRAILENGWCFYTHQDEGSSYFGKGTHVVNRIGYIVFSAPVNFSYINSYKELTAIAKEDEEFGTKVREVLSPIKDKCYVFLVKDPAKYSFEQVWTNKGLDKAKEIAKTRFRYPHKYYERKDYDKMEKIISQYNTQLAATTEKAKQLLAENGFTVVSANFVALQNC